jgi:chromate transport protein ChrA
MIASKKKPPFRTALLVYFVLVFLFAWAPWNGWLLAFGGAFYWTLYRLQKFAGRNGYAVAGQARRQGAGSRHKGRQIVRRWLVEKF